MAPSDAELLAAVKLTSQGSVSAASRSGSWSPPPPATGHNSGLKVRRFSSRHVPSSAEALVQSQALSPALSARFGGLMRHLKQNSEAEERQKQVMASSVEALIPEEYEETLRGEFERRCCFGERMNTELMSSGKWVRLLKDIGAVAPPRGGKGDPGGPRHTIGAAISMPEADIIFRKVIHACDYGGNRLTYELFCKALYLVALAAQPALDGEAALMGLLARVAAATPEEMHRVDETLDHMLDPKVLLVLDYFKPALHDIFHTFCTRNLSNPANGSCGMGTVRIRERSVWKHTQDTSFSGCGDSSYVGVGGRSESSQRYDSSSSPMRTRRSQAASLTPKRDAFLEPSFEERAGAAAQDEWRQGSAGPSAPAGRERRLSYPSLLGSSPLEKAGNGVGPLGDSDGGHNPVLAWAEHRGWASSMTAFGSTTGGSSRCGTSAGTRDPYEYANGAPVIKNRRSNMSVDQLLALCKDLQIMPEFLGRQDVVAVFKRAQRAGTPSNHGSSLYGYLTKESFVDAVGQLAIEAYSREPFCDEYPAGHEKVRAFFMRFLPGSSREAHDRFLYGCSGRGR